MAQKLIKKCPEMVKIVILMQIYGFSYLNDIVGGIKNSEGSDKI